MIRNLITRWRHRQTLKTFAKQIEANRKAHKPIRHIEAARSAYVHACLRGEVQT